MALFTITTKRRKICNGVQIEPGMTVQVVSPSRVYTFRLLALRKALHLVSNHLSII